MGVPVVQPRRRQGHPSVEQAPEQGAGLGEPARARTLAERLGITVSYTLPGLNEASLDLDV